MKEWSENEQVGVDKMAESEGVGVNGMEWKWVEWSKSGDRRGGGGG